MAARLSLTEIHDTIRELTEIETELDRSINTTMWVSDPHGAGERFTTILKGRFGLIWRTAQEALSKHFSVEKLDYLDHAVQAERYLPDEPFTMERQDVIWALVKIIRYKVEDIVDFEQIRSNINEDLKSVIENLILGFHVPDIVYENELIADKVITGLAKIVKQVILGQLVVLGDVFDRGDEPDRILRILSSREIRPYVRFVWGNHDILWMGAAAGNKSLIAEALRISVRYDNLAFLERLGINLEKLKAFAESLYPGGVTGQFKAKMDISRKMEKTLAMIQFKLEEKTIKQFPELQMDPRLNLEKFAAMLKTGDTEGLTDTHFPTLDPGNPLALTREESEVIDDLARQFTSSPKIRDLMKYLFEEGKLYHINNYILNIHALIPSTEEGKFDKLFGKKGKELMNHLEALVKNVGKRYLEEKDQDPFELAVMFYLWCGPKSPFFGKHAMKTFERYFFKDKVTHKEKTLHWGENLKKKEFMDLIMDEFGTERIVYGHTPVDIMKGEKISSPDGRAINIDGGFSEAYLGRGHSLIHTPFSIYAIILPSLDEIREAKHANLKFEEIARFDKPIKMKDVFRGKELRKRRDELLKKLREYAKKSR
ncbi:MAG TPA: fructose-bisphosphatase class III [Spirochaetota bacterium]|mgnify:CR=1 FL=1|nr:fructose-bisphosphatase class III [Spirochaetota bacterium]HOD16151.1 fructose-bisphosphatase class III [Spirochaetota bacterium]HPN10862.1 fructose-bisphosphatase class III [Spirochaetota bacterium]